MGLCESVNGAAPAPDALVALVARLDVVAEPILTLLKVRINWKKHPRRSVAKLSPAGMPKENQ